MIETDVFISSLAAAAVKLMEAPSGPKVLAGTPPGAHASNLPPALAQQGCSRRLQM